MTLSYVANDLQLEPPAGAVWPDCCSDDVAFLKA